ncbi:MAG: thymidylate synthase [Candidatus Zambryskibacteria bacterium RIFCSPLOWO2_01_FULL_45_43]|uniref:Thymidylate synthase n=1 Tax=Candidatus Zambryskibacteria bacterium RIFCSPLOWO2_01_FULL_45_43 TaxID=1802762 RepID=A0A1G2U6G2_9BACT|nr:MAG: thymidylate synthase [Candidatus Zambryskibacteria bacterium RIFCSPLOWO2_01_FULL_45_43]
MAQEKHQEYQYLDLLKNILKNGDRKVDKGTGDASYSLFGGQMRFDLSKGLPLLTTKKVYWKGVLHELYWFMSGQSNIKYLVDNGVHIWDDYPYRIYNIKNKGLKSAKKFNKEEFIAKIASDKAFAKKWGELPNIYGVMWRRWPTRTKRTIDQLRWAVEEIRGDSSAHNAIVNSWNPEYLYTMAERKDTSYFPICHNMYQINVIGKKLSLHLYQRSADIFLGVPFNIASYALLTIILAKVLGYKPGEFVHSFGDVHIYEKHREQAKEQLKRKPRPFPTVKIGKLVKGIDDFLPEHATLLNYDPHPPIKAELSVTGGFGTFKKNERQRD